MAKLGGRRVFFPWLLLFAAWLLLSFSANADSQVSVLLDFKRQLDDPDLVLENWDASTPLCQWTGVVCDGGGFVTGLNITSTRIQGPIHPGLCDAFNLDLLHLDNNYFSGPFPDGLFKCEGLVSLNLSQNLLEGPLPDGFSAFRNLSVLDLSYAYFNGSLPPSIGDLRQLEYLDLSSNAFTFGGIPKTYQKLTSLRSFGAAWNYGLEGPFLSSFDGLTNLESLQLQQNRLSGNISETIGMLANLTFLDLSNNSLTGVIPESIGNLVKLQFLDLADNQLRGDLPRSVSRLTSLTHLYLYNNQLTGDLAFGIGRFSNLTDFDVSNNSFQGGIPEDVVECKQLQTFHVQQNNLSGVIPEGFADLPDLSELVVFNNRLYGTIPERLGQNCILTRFDVSTNGLTGSIPPTLCNGGQLRELQLFSNLFSGSLPEAYGSCSSLTRIRIHQNGFSGTLPTGIWASPILDYLEISSNQFVGSVPAAIANASMLRTLRMNFNSLSGSLPPEIGQLVHLVVMEATNNRLEGPIPSTIGNMGNLTNLYLSSNQLTGRLPEDLGNCHSLANLDLSHNRLSGPIPASLTRLTFLSLLDLSSNMLSGAIPPELGQSSVISSLNISDNRLSGPLPAAYQSGVFSDSFENNPGLCGPGLSRQRKCPRHITVLPWILGWTFLAVSVLLIVSSLWCYRQLSRRQRRLRQRDAGPWRLKSFQKVRFSENDLLNSLDEDYVIGEGGAGKVYKVTLPDGQVVAVKKLWSNVKGSAGRNDHGFKAEVETLGKIRHRNIVKLLCCCSNRESNLLVYEFMENGSLGELLHSQKSSILDWPTRFKIALGSAQGLAYLHHDSMPQILHRDVKSNNILLDEDFEPHVADFGLAKILEKFSRGDSMSIVAGSYGYIAPEYGYTLKVSEKSDIYSFGVVLLELVTGKRPIEPDFGDGVDLVKWVSGKIETEDGLGEIMDPRLVGAPEDGMVHLLMLALRCTDSNPGHRPTMQQVVEYLRQAEPKQLRQGSKDWKGLFERTDSNLFDADTAPDVTLLVK